MIDSLLLVSSDSFDPYRNLALEEFLLGKVAPGACILYLWQNERTVVIGRNQSALEECKLQTLNQDGGHLARRLSGGGAVYHDLGNQNFTFLLPSADFDKTRQTEVLCLAMQKLGLNAQVSGRNDLTIEDRKFSGHAYYHSRKANGAGGIKCSYHHGTIMVDVDGAALSNYLNVNPLKLKAKGVKSVKSRVANLVDFRPQTTCEEVRQAVTEAFGEVYDLPVGMLSLSADDLSQLDELVARYKSEEWLLRGEEVLDRSAEGRFDWGTSRIDWTYEKGKLAKVALWSDGLDADLLEEIPAKLIGLDAQNVELAKAIEARGVPQQVSVDLAGLLQTSDC